ncbi:MAG: spermidine/putrescine ABC transporter substrate-binding protein [Rhodospirillaceae bacterium]|nr:spermidine/putrescine ABC transporter substrate-binding protein [Rhodospirillaceae bacterium]
MSDNFFKFMTRRRFLGASAGVAALQFIPYEAWSAEEKQLNVYNWDTYIGETTLPNFTKQTGIKVQYDLFGDNEEMFAKLKAGNPGYDIIVPTDYMVEDMLTLDMLETLDHSKLPNMSHLDKAFLNPAYDPGLKHSLPYMWGTMGYGYRKSKVKGTPDSWSHILENKDPSLSKRMSLLSDQRAVLGGALKYLGYSMNSHSATEIGKARDLVISAKKDILTFAEDNGQDLLVSGEVDLCLEWSGDIAAVMADDSDLNYVVPKEGSNVWVDNLCIPKGAPHPGNAHTFINFLHDVEVHMEIANTIYFATPNASAKAKMSADYTENPAVFAPADVLSRCEAILSVGDDARLYDEAWTAVQAA